MIGGESWVAAHGEVPGEEVGEVERIQTHLRHVISRLERVDVSALSPAQRANRAWALEGLSEYVEGGVFPQRDRGDGFSGRRPRFVDARGVHCAVGEMLRRTGHGALAQRIDGEHEFAFVPEIDTPGLARWASAFGFSVRELAMIQPSYGFQSQSPRAYPAKHAWLTAALDGEDLSWRKTSCVPLTESFERVHYVDATFSSHPDGMSVHVRSTPPDESFQRCVSSYLERVYGEGLVGLVWGERPFERKVRWDVGDQGTFAVFTLALAVVVSMVASVLFLRSRRRVGEELPKGS